MNHDHSMVMAQEEVAKDFLRRFFIVTGLLAPLAIFSGPGMKLLGYADFTFRAYLEFVIASAIFYFGLIFFEHAAHEIKAKQYGMMTLVSIAVGAGYLFSAAATFIPVITSEFYLEIATLIWVLLFAHFLEAKSSSVAGDALAEVAKLLPRQVHLIHRGKVHDVSVDNLRQKDVVRVLPGEKVPADGCIEKGRANFNEAHLSGESKPVSKAKGEIVVAGAICLDGSVEVRIEKVGENSTIGQIKKLVANAQKTKPSVQRLADRAAKWLTFTALTVAIITLFIWSALVGETFVFAMTLAITVLVIACPHALGLAIPTVSTIATRLAVANGLFIKDMGKLEMAKSAGYVVFDKTGTLTEGKFGVTKVKAIKETEKNLIRIAASLEAHSTHSIGRSIVKYAKGKNIKLKKVTDIKNIAGRGIEGKIGTKKYFIGKYQDIPIAVVSGNKVLGEIVLADKVKKESKKAIAALHTLGLKVVMLTGDNEKVAEKVSKKLGIDKYFAHVKPADKYKLIKKLQKDGDTVIMTGDGVNDAPALTQANVGVAIGAGTDVAVEAGDVVLTSSNPADVVSFIKLAHKVYKKMIQNLIWALGYNLLAIPAAAGLFIPFGFRLTPAVGALLMSASSVIVVANALTLRRAKLNS